MSNTTLASRILRALGETLDFYIALKTEEATLRDSSLAPTKALMPAEPGTAFGGTYAGKSVIVGRRKRGTPKVARSAAVPEQELSPAEDTQNIMNGILARFAGNTEPDGS